MDNRIYISAAIIFTIALLGIIAYNTLEIYHETENVRKMYPDRYYVLEQWLNETGNPVRAANWRDIKGFEPVKERAVVIYSSACKMDSADDSLLLWVRKGNSFVICVDNQNTNEMNIYLSALLSNYGIFVEDIPYSADIFSSDTPNFAWGTGFIADEDNAISVIKDNKGNIRLAEVSEGEGKITILGYPVFMVNSYMEKEVNARLAWELTGKRSDGSGVLFIRSGNTEKSFLGKIFER